MAFNVNQSVVGLQSTIVGTAPAAGSYIVQGKLTLPGITKGSTTNSSVVATIKKNNSTTLYTGNPGDTGFNIVANLAAGDYVNVILSSAATVDQGRQAVRMTVSMSDGQN